MEKQELTPEAILELKRLLPKGAQEKIAEKTGYHRVYVGQVLNGITDLNSKNIVIIEQAQKLAEEEVSKVNSRISKLNKFLSEQKA